MALIALWCFVLLAAALPGAWPRAFPFAEHPPDPWVALVVYLALRGRGYAAVGWGILVGATQDALSLDPLGTHAFVLGAVAFLFCEGRRHRPDVEGLPRAIATLAAALAAGWMLWLRCLPYGDRAADVADLLHAVPVAVWTTVLGAALFPLLDHLRVFDDLVGRPRGLPA